MPIAIKKFFTRPQVDTNFIECSSRYRLEHEKIEIRIHAQASNILFIK